MNTAFDSTIGTFINTPGNTVIIMGRFSSPAIDTSLLDAGGLWLVGLYGPVLFNLLIGDIVDYVVNVEMPMYFSVIFVVVPTADNSLITVDSDLYTCDMA